MSKQVVPDIDFDYFVVGEIKKLFDDNKIYVNQEYQRGDIWKNSQQIELIRSIEKRYSIGVLVLFINDEGKFEILDGQQRLLTIKKYLNDEVKLKDTDIEKYNDLSDKDRILIDAYCVYYLKLKSHDAESKEEDIIQTFLRLQEGTPLNKAEKVSANRGAFVDVFTNAREKKPLFEMLGTEKRFRWRLLAAEMLLLELKTDFKNNIFGSLDYPSFLKVIDDYKKTISNKKISFFNGNLDILYRGLNIILTGITSRELISFYLLVSYLRNVRADNKNLDTELGLFALEFMKNLNSFPITATDPPDGMDKEVFDIYKEYKQEARIQTTSDSIRKRFEKVKSEFTRLYPVTIKDPDRFHDEEEKRILFFRQKCLCTECGKPMKFKATSAHHVVEHKDGGKTKDLKNAVLLHPKCHQKLHKNK